MSGRCLRRRHWSDGEAFNADDVVFSIQVLIDNAPTLNDSAAMKDWVASVSKVDDLTVEFQLTRPNPRFQLDYFSVRIWGGVSISFQNTSGTARTPRALHTMIPPRAARSSPGRTSWQASANQNSRTCATTTGGEPRAASRSCRSPRSSCGTVPGNPRCAMADNQLDSLMDVTPSPAGACRHKTPTLSATSTSPLRLGTRSVLAHLRAQSHRRTLE